MKKKQTANDTDAAGARAARLRKLIDGRKAAVAPATPHELAERAAAKARAERDDASEKNEASGGPRGGE